LLRQALVAYRQARGEDANQEEAALIAVLDDAVKTAIANEQAEALRLEREKKLVELLSEPRALLAEIDRESAVSRNVRDLEKAIDAFTAAVAVSPSK
jgi:hypothetical protein